MLFGEKGQGAVEFLIILAVSLSIILGIYSLGSETVSGLNKQKVLDVAEKSATDLAGAIDDVYRQGEGAKRHIYYEIPDSADETQSRVENQAIVINVMGSDIFAETNAPLSGTLDFSPGGHWVWLQAYEGFVALGEGNIAIDKTSVYVSMSQTDSETETITITNNTAYAADFIVLKSWANTDVNMTIDDGTFGINAGEDRNMVITFSSSGSSAGNYAGYIAINASYDGSDANITVPVNAEIIAAEGGAFVIFPSGWNASIKSGRSSSANFIACNSTQADLSNVTFTYSSGDAGDWIVAIPDINTIPADSCSNLSVTISVPKYVPAGTYTGTITGTDSIGNSDAVALAITVTKSQSHFYFSWDGAMINSPGQWLQDWDIGNTSDEFVLTIDKIIVSNWSFYDQDNALLDQIELNSDVVWSAGGGTDGQVIDITDFNIPISTTYTINQFIKFDGKINDDDENFAITFIFDDNGTYTTTPFTQVDNEPPIIYLEAPAAGGTSYTTAVQFDYNVTDTLSGVASCELIIDGVSVDSDTSITEGTTQSFTRTLSPGAYRWDVNCTDNSAGSYEGSSDKNRLLYVVTLGPFTVDLWELQADLPQPLDFSTDINSTANTFGAGSGNDGWDWAKGVYRTGTTCVFFNADPNFDGSKADSTVGSDNEIRIQIGDWLNCASSGTNNSGAYGVQFDINSDHWLALSNGATATLTFNWDVDDQGLDSNDELWIKARIGNAILMNYLGSALDSGDSHADATNEVVFQNAPADSSGSQSINVTAYISGTGAYYLELGSQVNDWGNNEWADVGFDNINLVIS